MELLIGSLLLIPFLYFNYKIILSDLQIQRIPNKQLINLLILLPFIYLYFLYYGYFLGISSGIFTMQILLIIIIGFLLFYFHIWGAGDAKYLLVLSLFIPHIGIIPFIGNIALVTLGYLLLYFIWFWIGPNLWIVQKRKELYKNLWKIKKDSFLLKNTSKTKKEMYLGILRWLNIFIIIFISIRLIKRHIIEFLVVHYDTIINLINIILLLIICTSLIFICVSLLILIGKKYIQPLIQNFQKRMNSWAFLLICNIFGISFLLYEYFRSPEEMTQNLIFILTIGIITYIIYKSILFAYRLVFIYKEEEFINIKDLKGGMIIDKKSLQLLLNMQYYITDNFGEDIITKLKPKAFFGPIDSHPYIKNLGNPISQFEADELKEIYQKVNSLHKKYKTPSYTPFQHIKVLNTFSFGPYIFSGFVLTGIVSIFIKTTILSIIIQAILQFYS